VSRGGGHPSSQQKEEPGWPHAFGRCLRAVLHRAATSLGLPLPMSSNCICIAAPYAPQLSDEDDEQGPDRWCSHSAWGQECWQLVSQWVWNLRAVRWGISCILMPCARPSLLLPSHLPHPLPLSTAHGSSRGLCSPSRGPALESWSLLWTRLCSPARWDAALPGFPEADPA